MSTPTARAARAARSLLLAGAVVIGSVALTSAPAGAADEPAPVIGREGERAVPDEYIVVLQPGRGANERRSASAEARASGGQVRHEYDAALNGFAARLPQQAVERLQRNPNVAYIEADQIVTSTDNQANPPWGLDRIDQRALPLNGNYQYLQTGAGVKAYIIDTGIRVSHTQFGGRAVHGFDAIDGSLPADDCNGHGTHVAGTVGASVYGVAKAVTLVAVRVLNCAGSGTNSQVIAGINWVTSDHPAGAPAVANMSLGGGVSTALDTAVTNSINDGVTYAVSAGNGNVLGLPVSACTQSPARLPAAITVSATGTNDAKASYANYGTCLDLFAPGNGILSSWSSSDTATNTISGTSMATPHVAGAAALYLQTSPTATPQQVRDQLVNTATPGVVTNPGAGSPNRLLYALGGSTPPPPPPPPPSCAVETFNGTLSGPGDADIHPNGSYWSAPAGTHHGCLTGPAGTDFDLALYRWNGSSWTRVAVSQGVTSTENITYNGTAGYYYWRVYSYSGTGSYTLKIKRP